jgi:hypothetical protein
MYRFELNQDDLANLILQRTNKFLEWGGGAAFAQWVHTGGKDQLVGFLAGQNKVKPFIDSVCAEISAEFEPLKPHIVAAKPGMFVSIGPGLAILELMVFRSCGPLKFTLIDIEQSAEHQHGYAQKGSGYASLESCKRFLVANGVDAASVTCCNPRKQPLPSGSFDMLVSLLSMGFHYPCDEYAAFIRDGLRKDGILIFDKRKGVPDAGWLALAPLFDTVAAFPAVKYDRLVLRRK